MTRGILLGILFVLLIIDVESPFVSYQAVDQIKDITTGYSITHTFYYVKCLAVFLFVAYLLKGEKHV